MRLYPGILLSLLASVPSCHGQQRSTPTPRTLDASERAAIWQSVYLPIFDSVVASAGLPRLRTSRLPPGHREVRVWIGGGLGYPQDLYRFVDDRGRLSGELVRYWGLEPLDSDRQPGETFNDLMLYSLRGSCSQFSASAQKGTCRADFIRSPDWGAVLRRAEAEGLWKLPDQSALPDDGIMVVDGWAITVELRDASNYRVYHYSNPDAHKPSAEGESASRIAQAVRAIDSLRRTPDVVKTYRGITTGAYHSEFVDCATGARWEFYDELRSLAERSKVPFQPASDSSARYVVEVVGELTPEWLARQWGSKYERALQVSRLVSVRPSLDRVCPNER